MSIPGDTTWNYTYEAMSNPTGMGGDIATTAASNFAGQRTGLTLYSTAQGYLASETRTYNTRAGDLVYSSIIALTLGVRSAHAHRRISIRVALPIGIRSRSNRKRHCNAGFPEALVRPTRLACAERADEKGGQHNRIRGVAGSGPRRYNLRVRLVGLLGSTPMTGPFGAFRQRALTYCGFFRKAITDFI